MKDEGGKDAGCWMQPSAAAAGAVGRVGGLEDVRREPPFLFVQDFGDSHIALVAQRATAAEPGMRHPAAEGEPALDRARPADVDGVDAGEADAHGILDAGCWMLDAGLTGIPRW